MIDQFDKPDAETRQGTSTDRHVGLRLRLRRTMVGISQQQLGAMLGITCQQVQKYERGLNRIGASRLFEIAHFLDAPVSFFFDGLTAERVPGDAEAQSDEVPADPDQVPTGNEVELICRRETLELVRAYYRIPDAGARRHLLDLINSIVASSAVQH